MISRNSTLLLAKLYTAYFSVRRSDDGCFYYQALDVTKLHSFFYRLNYPSWFCYCIEEMSKASPQVLRSFITSIHTGEIFECNSRYELDRLCQVLLARLTYDLLQYLNEELKSFEICLESALVVRNKIQTGNFWQKLLSSDPVKPVEASIARLKTDISSLITAIGEDGENIADIYELAGNKEQFLFLYSNKNNVNAIAFMERTLRCYPRTIRGKTNTDHHTRVSGLSHYTSNQQIFAPMNRKADILLVTVTKVEAQAVLSTIEEKYDRTCGSVHIDNLTYRDLGIIGGARTFMIRSEMGAKGPSGSILTVSESIRLISPSSVIMVGISFGMDSTKQQIGDILVSKQIVDYELQKIATGSNGGLHIIPRGDRPSASPWLLNKFRDAELSWNGANVQFGLILSGEKLIDNVNYKLQLQTIEPEAIGGEMEGAGLYASAYQSNVDWILVKSICDWADGYKSNDKQQNQIIAAKNAAEFIFYVIERGGFVR